MRTTICALFCASCTFIALPAAAQLSGEVLYTGTASGKIVVEAFTEADANFEKLSVSMVNPGPFEFAMPADGNYTVVAFIDEDDNARLDTDEIWIEAAASISVPPGQSGISLDLDGYVPPAGDSADPDEGGCAVAPRTGSSPWALLVGLCGALIWRRRTF